MLGEQYGILLSTVISAGLVIAFYPALIEGLIFIAIILWISLFKLIKWAEKKGISGYITSIFASISAIYGVYYLTKSGLWWFILGYVYLVFAIYIMKSTIEEIVTYG